ncbi:hypothetical protein [Yersinia intermedia]|uniref:Uncharacterized protein n=1 Tax=Yersinia intermedia TaxID=631 RepID=A0A0T9LS21_YERIN|nr:hypothetical protein [Yersinia intermedia]CNF19318.1 Uncharacterised protein [Yersinia intermedia]
MDITKSRKEFEAWLKSRDCNPVGWLKDEYWEVWKSARESIEVELPPRKSADIESEKYPDMTMYEAMMREGIWNDCIFECEKILRTACIRIKGESE